MAVPVLNYSTPRDELAARRKAWREVLKWLFGLVLSFFGFSVTIVIVGATRARLGARGIPLAVVELAVAVSVLFGIARSYHRQYNSWSFARGAVIGALVPVIGGTPFIAAFANGHY